MNLPKAFTVPFCTPHPTARLPPLFDAIVVCRCSGDYRWVVCCTKKKEHTYRGYHLPWRKKGKKKQEKEKRCRVLNSRTLDSLMVSPLRYSGMNLPNAFTLPFCTPPHAYPPLFNAVVVCRCSVGDYRWVVCCKKKKEHTYRGHHLPWRNKKEKKKRCRVSNSRTSTV